MIFFTSTTGRGGGDRDDGKARSFLGFLSLQGGRFGGPGRADKPSSLSR
jgi:hypothetical protein